MTASPTTVVWVDGALRDPATASVHWSDHGLTVGDGVFETIELRRGQPFALTRHLRRLERSAAGMYLTPPDTATLRAAVSAVANAWGTEPGRLRITYTGGPGPMGSDRGDTPPTLVVAATAMTVQVDPTDVVVVPFTRNERGALAGLKTTSYGENVVALHIAHANGASEALFANTVGSLCEGTGSNVVVGIDGRLVTPTLSSGCLDGITRALLLEALAAGGIEIVEEDLAIERLIDVDEAFLVSTGRHVQPIGAVDGHRLRSCPGPLTSAARRIWVETYDHFVDP